MPINSHPIIEQIQGLRRYARALTGGKMENADDLVQDTLERAYSKWHLFKVDTELRPWLFSIMHNVFVNEMRLLKHRVIMDSIDDTSIIGTPAPQESYVQARETLIAVGRLAPELLPKPHDSPYPRPTSSRKSGNRRRPSPASAST